LRAIFDALKPGGLLSVTEIVFDPHFRTRATVTRLALDAGFRERAFYGNRIAYSIHGKTHLTASGGTNDHAVWHIEVARSRSMIALEELGLSYTRAAVQNGITAADHEVLLALNPNSRIPVLDHDGCIVWESMAINLYLADAYGGPLWPDDARRRLIYQWSFWVQAEMDRRDWQKAWRTRDAEQMATVQSSSLRSASSMPR
jgi:hypothetical protein